MEYLLNLDNTQSPNKMNEVHTSICSNRPISFYMTLGNWDNEELAIMHAKKRGYINTEGCRICCQNMEKIL